MATNNYVNPTSLMPQVGFRPEGFLGGHMLAGQEQMFKQAMAQQQAMQNLDMLKQQMEMDTYQQDAPLRAANRNLGIATANAKAPIQGQLAAGEAADADYKTQTLDSRVASQKFKNSKERNDYAQDQIGNTLSSILSSKLPPQEMMMKWQQEGVPYIEQITGEKVPEQFRSMNPAQMQMVAEQLTTSAKHRQEMEKQADQLTRQGQNSRAVAEIQAAAHRYTTDKKGDATTAAELRKAEMEKFKEAMIEQMMTQALNKMPAGPNRGLNEQQFADIQQQAQIKASNLFFGANPQGKLDTAVGTDAAKRENANLQFEIMTAQPAPRDPSKREIGKLYRADDGRAVRWMGGGWKEEKLQGQQ